MRGRTTLVNRENALKNCDHKFMTGWFWIVFNKQWKNAEFLDFRTVYASMRLSLISRAGQNMRV